MISLLCIWNFFNRPWSNKNACLIASAQPEFNSLSFKVSNDFVSIAINNGCLKAPIKFLPCLKFTPVLPPIDASTIAAKLVGKWITFNPLNHEDATNPTRSVVTPPPIEIKILFLSDPTLNNQSYM